LAICGGLTEGSCDCPSDNITAINNSAAALARQAANERMRETSVRETSRADSLSNSHEEGKHDPRKNGEDR
jgi:hypothetical protein